MDQSQEHFEFPVDFSPLFTASDGGGSISVNCETRYAFSPIYIPCICLLDAMLHVSNFERISAHSRNLYEAM